MSDEQQKSSGSQVTSARRISSPGGVDYILQSAWVHLGQRSP
ncbi:MULTISPECIES: hypothetical protein [Brasilonema]|nr:MULTISPECIES: hypothetical protein [Brasilonema]